jgi:uncharacterized protein
MPTLNLTPVPLKERIQAIDIIRGFALLGILIINFTVDNSGDTPYDGWTSFGDQFVYWSVRLLLDDRFQTIYCFLFGLGFAIQMQKRNEINSSTVFVFIRRMIVLFLFGYALQIFAGTGFIVISYYAIVGILLLLFVKVPTKFLPALSLLFFVFPRIITTVEKVHKEHKPNTVNQKNVIVDRAVLDKYVGVFQDPAGQKLILHRQEDSLIGENPKTHFALIAQSDTQFLRKEYNILYTFIKNSTGTVNKISITSLNFPEYSAVSLVRIQDDVKKALQQRLQERADATKGSSKKTSYREFVKKNEYLTRYYYITNFPWQKFLWKGNYELGYILVLFLAGLYAGRKKIFQDVAANARTLRFVLKWGLIVGGILVAFSIAFEMWNAFQGIKYWDHYPALTLELLDLPWGVGIIILAMAYIAGLILLLEKEIWKKRLSFFATVGRMGLTNYCLHLIAGLLIFENVSWFLGLDGKAGCLYRLLIALGVYALLYLFSRWWLTYFRMGPLEWLWRSAAYWKWQPMRKEETVQTPDIAVARI